MNAMGSTFVASILNHISQQYSHRLAEVYLTLSFNFEQIFSASLESQNVDVVIQELATTIFKQIYPQFFQEHLTESDLQSTSSSEFTVDSLVAASDAASADPSASVDPSAAALAESLDNSLFVLEKMGQKITSNSQAYTTELQSMIKWFKTLPSSIKKGSLSEDHLVYAIHFVNSVLKLLSNDLSAEVALPPIPVQLVPFFTDVDVLDPASDDGSGLDTTVSIIKDKAHGFLLELTSQSISITPGTIAKCRILKRQFEQGFSAFQLLSEELDEAMAFYKILHPNKDEINNLLQHKIGKIDFQFAQLDRVDLKQHASSVQDTLKKRMFEEQKSDANIVIKAKTFYEELNAQRVYTPRQYACLTACEVIRTECEPLVEFLYCIKTLLYSDGLHDFVSKIIEVNAFLKFHYDEHRPSLDDYLAEKAEFDRPSQEGQLTIEDVERYRTSLDHEIDVLTKSLVANADNTSDSASVPPQLSGNAEEDGWCVGGDSVGSEGDGFSSEGHPGKSTDGADSASNVVGVTDAKVYQDDSGGGGASQPSGENKDLFFYAEDINFENIILIGPVTGSDFFVHLMDGLF